MSERGGWSVGQQFLLWLAGNSLTGAVIGLALGFFRGGAIEGPTVGISVLFANVVGCTAFVVAVLLFPRLGGLPRLLRPLLLGLALLSGSILGSLWVLAFYPLFVIRELRESSAIVALNAFLALVVGAVVFAYESMRARLQRSLHEVEEVRLVEARWREEAARAELAALQARINPHFFFNTLNTIASLLEEDPERAGEVVQTLADLFRYTFKLTDSGPVTLQEELDFTRHYLSIERARFGDRLRLVFELDPASLQVRLPGLILQPLVENAVGHGLGSRAGGGTLRIASRLGDGLLELEVTDDGAGLRHEPQSLIRDGHGLGNVRRRLLAAYGERAALTLGPNPRGRGTQARLVLPAPPLATAGAAAPVEAAR